MPKKPENRVHNRLLGFQVSNNEDPSTVYVNNIISPYYFLQK